MSATRHAGVASLAMLAIALVGVGWDGAQGEERVPLPPPAAKCQRAAFRVMVDVGHTLEHPGAMSARGTTEYEFNLYLAQDIKQALVDAGFRLTRLLITAAAPPQSLFDRVQRADAWHADLFIAVHHDSVPDDLIKTWQFEGQDEHYNDDYPGYALFISNDNADRAGSLAFAHLLGKALQARGLQYTPHYTLPIMGHRRRELLDADAGVYRYDALVVLRHTHMPAVLLEAGSIVNRGEELELVSVERRAITSAAVVSAVEDFCAARARGRAPKARPAPAR